MTEEKEGPQTGGAIGILEPQSILGKAIGERLVELDPRVEIRAFSSDPGQSGEVAEFGRGAALIEVVDLDALAPGSLEVSVLFAPVATSAAQIGTLRRGLPAGSRLVLADGSGWSSDLNLVAAEEIRLFPAIPPLLGAAGAALGGEPDVVLLSPSPSVVCQGLLLHALRDLGPLRCSTTVLEPVSAQSSQAVDELLDQTRSILAFTGEMPTEHLGDQQAFNVLALGANDHRDLLRHLTGVELESAEEQVLRAGVFHGVALSLQCLFADALTTTQIAEAVSSQPPLQWQEASQDARHPVSVAGKGGLFVSCTTGSNAPRANHWFWLLADNLTTVGAWNAVALGMGESTPSREIH